MLKNTTAVVTGASSGIGTAVAEALAAQGATVALFARRRDRLTELAEAINARDGGRAHPYAVDVTDADAVRAAIESAAGDHGGIDILVNNAGSGTWSPALEADLTDWHSTVEVNVNGVLNTTHAALPHLTRAASGERGVADLVTISSVAGRRIPTPQSNVYAATKHAVSAFTEALRQELAERHVRAGLVEPGVVVTELTTSGQEYAPDARNPTGYGLLRPEDVATAVVFMVTQPRHAAVNEILLRPTEQVR
ncbi:SDR family oxidoreductase [Streptomyces sp. PTM05]|uniref:SDR family oxidoreductase n=1 Tax=Streptantibioticus parmotrematis TaxID=2873249 RepID=A0ABS7QPU9_9ACTN|nr:SDR family oxidoreductase [Streptantibioticus parmotrematis]MBY8885205.1 SDR family oxidoreductase [Streptantibioticus parmotrematis]